MTRRRQGYGWYPAGRRRGLEKSKMERGLVDAGVRRYMDLTLTVVKCEHDSVGFNDKDIL